MRWPPKSEDRTAWSAVGGVITAVMAGSASVSPLKPLFIVLACVGFYICLAPLLLTFGFITCEQTNWGEP